MKIASAVLLLLVACSTSKKSTKPSASAMASSKTEVKTTKVPGKLKPGAVLEPYPGLKIYQYKMDSNGMTVLLLPRKQNETLAVTVSYEVGSRNEEIGKTGLAHLFEHMMFRGTENYPEPFATLSEWGGEYNAFTTQDLTAYQEVAPSNKIDDLLKFESERMRKLLITPQIFNTERGAVVSERKMNYEDSPNGRLFWELYQLAFDKHPYKTTPIGWQEDIDNATYEDALSFYNHYYVPDRATLVLVGDIDLDKTTRIIEKYFGSFAPANYPDPSPPVEKLQRKNRRKTIKIKTESAYVGDAAFAPTFTDPKSYAELFFCVLFADSSAGYLAHTMVDGGFARGVSSQCYPDHDPGLSIIKLVALPGMSAKALEKKYLETRKGFLKWLTPERFENTKKYFETGQLESLRNPLELAVSLSNNNTQTGNPLYSFELVEKVKQLKVKDIEERFYSWEKRARTGILIEPSAKTDPMKKETTK